MDYVYSIVSNVKYYYNAINPATLSGAIDVIVVEQPDGSCLSTPFHVRFGKWAVFNIDDKFVDIQINNEMIEGIKMKLGDNGVAFFVEEIEGEEELPEYLATSPVPGASESDSEENVRTSKKSETRKKANTTSKKTHKRNKSIFDPASSKQGLPFSSSIFSYRKYRSLPDLSAFSQYPEETTKQPPLNHLDLLSSNQSSRQISHSRSTIISKEIEALESANQPPKQSKWKKKLESGSDNETKQQKIEKTSTPRSVVDIADGALSDSEVERVDRQRYENHTNDGEWHWGEYPSFNRSKEKHSETNKKDKSKTTEHGGRWSWFRWGGSQAPQEEGVYLGDLMNKDPNQLEKYFGTSCASQVSNVDSGNGYSVQASPSSPSALSIASLVEENVSKLNTASDPTRQEAPTPNEVEIALKRADIIEKQVLAGTNENADTHTNTLHEEAQKHLEKQGSSRPDPLPAKSRSMSGASVSEMSSIDEGDGVFTYTSGDDGKRVRYKRTLRLKSDQLKYLQLQYGSNNARFSISTKIQGTAWCACHIYLLKWHERIVISDIDGTITKSDVLGHIIPAIGGTWAHTNIVDLYRRIQNNGYRIVYLSSRPIGQSYQTKRYLSSVIQDSKTLPDGPVLLSPASVLMAFRKEVIEKKPEEFKIACLTDLLSLFPVKNPFYAGFGNRETDIKSYVAVGIPPERILIINPTGKVENAARIGFETSYDHMLRENVVDHFFPPIHPYKRSRLVSDDEFDASNNKSSRPLDYTSFVHWRAQPNDLNDEDLEKYEVKKN